METINKNGLNRYIPSDIRRMVRQRCGFGCVICGNPIVQYEHFDPPFADATEHKASGITLLCGGCHDKKTRGIISTSTIMSHNDNPISLKKGYNREAFDITSSAQTIRFCGTNYHGVKTIVGIHDKEILSVSPPECIGAPIRISAIFYDANGSEILRIIDNEWFSNTSSWDIEINGPTLKIRRGEGDVALQLRTIPPDTIEIERISMLYDGVSIEGDHEKIEVKGASGSTLHLKVRNFYGNGKGVALAVTKKGILYGVPQDYESLLRMNN